MPPPLSVVVCTRDRPEQLRRCLVALCASLRDGDELLVMREEDIMAVVNA